MPALIPHLLASALSTRFVNVIADFGILVMVVGFLLCLVRLVRGPHLADRALALDTIAIHLIGIVVLFTMRVHSLVLFDGVLVLSLLGFAGSIAVAQYIVRLHFQKKPVDPALHESDR